MLFLCFMCFKGSVVLLLANLYIVGYGLVYLNVFFKSASSCATSEGVRYHQEHRPNRRLQHLIKTIDQERREERKHEQVPCQGS